MDKTKLHTFALCAYKESPYIEDCVKSLLKQTVKTNIIICTSTPNDYVKAIADKYKLKYFVREGQSNMRDDWNFAIQCAETDYVTIAHQDDIYFKHYAEELLKRIPDEKMTLYFTGYYPIMNGKIDKRNMNCRIKHLLVAPLKHKRMAESKWWRKRAISLGCSICCPAVTYNKRTLGENVFKSTYKCCIDWETYLECALLEGHFVYVDKPLMGFRVHEQATSKSCIVDNSRVQEDYEMFCRFWPKWVAKILMIFYKKAYSAYD